MTENTKKFDKIWEKEFDIKDEDAVRYVKITTINQEDYKEKREGDYGEEIIYTTKLATPEGIQDAELIVNENKKALGKIKIGDKYYTIWKFVNEDGVSMAFKYNDAMWVKVEKRKDKNDNVYYKIKFSYKEDKIDEIEEEEIPF